MIALETRYEPGTFVLCYEVRVSWSLPLCLLLANYDAMWLCLSVLELVRLSQ